ncbi:MAG: hypothetical protein ACLRYE_04165 [Gemmiger formicilis]
MLAYAGLSIYISSQGNCKSCYAHMEKRGSRYLR